MDPTEMKARVSSDPVMRRNSSRRSGVAYSLRTGIRAACIMPLMTRSKSIVWMLSAMVKAATESPVPKR